MLLITKFVTMNAEKGHSQEWAPTVARPSGLPLSNRHSSTELAEAAGAIALVAISPLGHEGTHPVSFLLYRTLLIGMIGLALWRACASASGRKPDISIRFLVAWATGLTLSLCSILTLDGSLFDPLYWWYNDVLFVGAFIALSTIARHWQVRTRLIVLAGVVLTNLSYLVPSVLAAERPILATFVNPNYFASYLLVGFAVVLATLTHAQQWKIRVAALGAAFLYLYGFAQAFSRGATMAAGAVILLAAVRYNRWTAKRLIAAGLVLIAALAGGTASTGLIRKFTDFNAFDPYNYTRPQIWLSTVRMIGDHPVLGIGRGQYPYVSPQYAFPVEDRVARYLKRAPMAHSQYLHYPAEIGIPASLILLSALGYLWIRALRRRNQTSSFVVLFNEAALLTGTGLAVHALVDNNWTVPVLSSAIVVCAMADLVPRGSWTWAPSGSRQLRTLLLGILGVLLVHSTFLPFVALAFNEVGHRNYRAGNLDGAETWHRMALTMAPGAPTFLDNAGTVYLERYRRDRKLRDLELAESYFDRAAAANPRDDQYLRHRQNAALERLTGDREQDLPIHETVIRLNRRQLEITPTNPFVRSNLAEALLQSGKLDEAVQELNNAIAYEPNYVPAYLQLSRLHAMQNNLEDSRSAREHGLAVLERFLSYRTDEPYELLLLGRPLPQAKENP